MFDGGFNQPFIVKRQGRKSRLGLVLRIVLLPHRTSAVRGLHTQPQPASRFVLIARKPFLSAASNSESKTAAGTIVDSRALAIALLE